MEPTELTPNEAFTPYEPYLATIEFNPMLGVNPKVVQYTEISLGGGLMMFLTDGEITDTFNLDNLFHIKHEPLPTGSTGKH